MLGKRYKNQEIKVQEYNQDSRNKRQGSGIQILEKKIQEDTRLKTYFLYFH